MPFYYIYLVGRPQPGFYMLHDTCDAKIYNQLFSAIPYLLDKSPYYVKT